MARSNGPQPQARNWPPEPPQEQGENPQSGIGFLQGWRGPQPPPQPGYAQPGAARPFTQGQYPQQSDDYPQPQQPSLPPQQSYPPPFEAYPQQHGARSQGQPAPSAYTNPPPEFSLSQLAVRPPPQTPYYDPAANAGSRPPPEAWPQASQPDPRAYDPGVFAANPQMQVPQEYGDPNPGWSSFDQGLGHDPAAGHQADYPDDQGDYDEEPHRRGGLMKIVIAVLSVIVVAGGLLYAYRTYIASDTKTAAPTIRGDGSPARTKPTEVGGRQFDHQDKKIMDGRLGEADGGGADGSAASQGGGQSAEAGARQVPTFGIARDGSILPPPAAADEGSRNAGGLTSTGVPGLSVVDAGSGQPLDVQMRTRAPQGPAPAAAEKPIAVSPPPAAEKPVVISKVKPQTEPAAQPDGTPAPPAEKAVADEPAPPVAPKKPPQPKRTAAAAPPPAAAAASTGSNGFVAVLASVPSSGSSRMDALKQFADMQQKYSSVLANKTPDVRQVDLGAKGSFDRLLVGPPSSKEQASALCSELKAAGYPSCWVTAY